jgi:membrane-associated phospholipid phosphatase
MADIAPEWAPPRGEVAALVAIQSALADRPGAVAAARALSYFGEHSIGWLAVSAIGALMQSARRRAWLVAGAGALTAHAAAVLIKRLVRRPRPHHPAVAVNVGTPSSLSFPSAHATSTTAASILLARATGVPLPVMLVPPMALSRVLLGVHYPSDVATGVALGATVAGVAAWVDGRLLGDDAGRATARGGGTSRLRGRGGPLTPARGASE